MGELQYPSRLDTILDKPALLIAVDRTVELVNENTADDETRLAELMVQLTALCLNQAKLVIRSAYPHDVYKFDDVPFDQQERFYHIVLEADQRWDIVRQYLQDTRQLEIHPLAMISMIRGCTLQDPKNQTELDHMVIYALDKYAMTMEDEIRKVMGWTDDDIVRPAELPSVKNDPELLMEFFQAFKAVGTVYRKRSDYKTDEQRQAYDKLMAIFKAITE